MNTKLALPDLSSDYAISAEQVAAYQRDGHLLVRQLATGDEIAHYRPLITHAVRDLNTERRDLSVRDTYGKAFLQTMNLWETRPEVKAFSFAQRFAKVAAQLMGVDGVRLYHDQALFKEPGGGATPWHQDQHYWPLATDKTITVWIALVDIPAEVGIMTFASGSHTQGYLGEFEISDKSQAQFDTLIRDKGFGKSAYGGVAAGDATFHSGWTLHSAPANPSTLMREAMTIIYYADGTRVGPADHKNREDDLSRWLPGLKPGDLAASSLNPVLYNRV